MVAKRVNTTVRVDASQGIAAWEKYGSAARSADGSVAGAGKTTESALGKLRQFGFVATATAVAVDQLSQRALEFSDVTNNTPFSLDKASKSLGGLVTGLDTAKLAVTGNRLEVAKTSKEFAKFARIGSVLARTQGIEATKGVSDFTLAVARSSTKVLDNLGIIVKQGEANDIYAARIGKTTSELSDNEKKEAFKQLAIERGLVAVRQAKLDNEGLAITLQRLKIALIDAGDAALNVDKNIAAFGEELSDLGVRVGLTESQVSTGFDGIKIAARASLAAVTLGGSEAGIALIGLASDTDEMAGSQQRGLNPMAEMVDVMMRQTDQASRLAVQISAVADQEERRVFLAKQLDATIVDNLRKEAGKEDAKARKGFRFDRERAEAEQRAQITLARNRARKKDTRSEFEKLLGLDKGAEKRTDRTIGRNAEGNEIDLLGDISDQAGRGIDFSSQVAAAREFEAAKSEAILTERMRHVEVMAANGLDAFTLIEAEEIAQVEFLSRELERLEAQGASKADLLMQEQAIAQAHHEAEIARMEERTRLSEKRFKEQQGLVLSATGQVNGAFDAMARGIVMSGELSAEGIRKSVSGFATAQTIEMSLLAISETARGFAAAASPFTAPLAPGHFIAAKQAGVAAAVAGGIAGATALGGFGGSGGGGGAANTGAPGSFAASGGRPASNGGAANSGVEVDGNGVPLSVRSAQQGSGPAPDSSPSDIGPLVIFGDLSDDDVDKFLARINERQRSFASGDR